MLNVRERCIRKKEEITISSFEKEIMVNKNNIDIKEKRLALDNQIMPINMQDKEFDLLMNIYKIASENVVNLLNEIKIEYNKIYEHTIIDHITSRIKAPQSIVNKMKKKNLELNYENLIEKINDIAGVRIICPIKDDIYTIVKIIEKIPNWKILKVKDYIKNKKRSGYSGYHIIVEVPIEFNVKNNKQQILVKVEIQLRTMAMDFWAANEHKIKYKTSKKLSFLESKKLTIYAKIIDFIDNGFTKLVRN